jgi:succinate dehydrogenase / fumarate reductase, cytochrome b subunit
MNWIVKALSSTIGRKWLMGFTGLFLCLFLVVHLTGNLQLLANDRGESFNKYAQFMGHNPLIQTISIGNFFFIILHVIVAIFLTKKNAAARPIGYHYSNSAANSSWSSRNMGILGTLILIFIVVHLSNFWYVMKFGSPLMADYNSIQYKDLYTMSREAFSQLWLVILYVISMIALAFHLAHGFKSAFQTFGLNHVRYNGLIRAVGLIFAILIPAAFAMIPVYVYLSQQ